MPRTGLCPFVDLVTRKFDYPRRPSLPLNGGRKRAITFPFAQLSCGFIIRNVVRSVLSSFLPFFFSVCLSSSIHHRRQSHLLRLVCKKEIFSTDYLLHLFYYCPSHFRIKRNREMNRKDLFLKREKRTILHILSPRCRRYTLTYVCT